MNSLHYAKRGGITTAKLDYFDDRKYIKLGPFYALIS